MDNIFSNTPKTYESRVLIGGTWFEKDDVFSSLNPATSEVVGSAPICNLSDVTMAVEAAHAALPAWKKYSPLSRFSFLESLRALILEEARELATLAALETGRTLGEVYATEIMWVLEFLRDLGEFGPELTAAKSQSTWRAPALWRGQHQTRLIPRGVSGVITGYGFPLAQPLIQISLALAAGNTVVFKPSELASLTGIRVAALFKEAEFPPGAVNMITGSGETGQLLSQADLDVIQFTGKQNTAKKIWSQCASRMPHLDLHGKDNWPVLVMEDANPEEAVDALLWAASLQGGQTSLSPGRVLVHESIHESFIKHLAEAMGKLKPVDLQAQGQVAPLANKDRLTAAQKLVSNARDQGAQLSGTAAWEVQGNFLSPVALCKVSDQSDLWQQNQQAPILAIQSFNSTESGLAKSHQHGRAVALSLWTRDEEIISRCQELAFGTIWINELGFTLGSGRLPWDHSQWVGGISSLGRQATISQVTPGGAKPSWRMGAAGEEAFENMRHLLHGSWSESLRHLNPTLKALRSLREKEQQ